LKWRWLPTAFGAPLLLLLIVGGLAGLGIAALRGGIWIAEATTECPEATAYTTESRCYRLGSVEAGQLYRVTVKVTAPWSDLSISTNPEGFGPTRMSFSGNLLAPLRRSPSARWFQPLIKVAGSTPGSSFHFYQIVPLEMRLTDPEHGLYAAEFVAPIGGGAQFFVNDVVLPSWLGRLAHDWYRNNHGTADITMNVGFAPVDFTEWAEPAARWPFVEKLAQRSEDAEDPLLPLMLWYATEPLVKTDLARASKLAGETKIPLLRTSIARRIASGN